MRSNGVALVLAGLGACAVAGPVAAQVVPPIGGAYSHEARIAALEAQIATLSPVLELVQSGRLEVVTNEKGVTALRLTGINLQVVNGGGAGNIVANGTGNILIGYDEERVEGVPSCSQGQFPDEGTCIANGATWAVSHKSGSHYLVVGREHNYSRQAGILGGLRNTSNGPSGSVVGGRDNTASGARAAVLGGIGNTATGGFATVSGGDGNRAAGGRSSVSGGYHNGATGQGSSVSAGYNNSAAGDFTGVSAGSGNIATGWAASVSGGQDNTATAEGSSVSGGFQNAASGFNGSVNGGANNAATSSYSSVLGGQGKSADQDYQTIWNWLDP